MIEEQKNSSTPVDYHKLAAFKVAPVRKTAFEKAKEQAQVKADREAAETAAVYEDFVAEYAPAEITKSPIYERDSRSQSHSGRNVNQQNYRKRGRGEIQESPNEDFHHRNLDEGNSEDEERERRRIRLKSSANFLNELKEKNRKRDYMQPPEHERLDPNPHYGSFQSSEHRSQGQSTMKQSPAHAESASDEDEVSSDDINHYTSKSSITSATRPLNSMNKARLKFLLDTTTARRGSIARVTAFALTHASSIPEICDTICGSVHASGLEWKASIARLWCISDILHNSWLPIPNVWKYRTQMEERLSTVFEKLRDIGAQIESRIRNENFKRLVVSVLDLWNTWICFSEGAVDRFYDSFEDKKLESTNDNSDSKEQKKAANWKKLASAPADAQQDGVPVDLDGEAIDLDGEEFDLDGDSVELDAPNDPKPTTTTTVVQPIPQITKSTSIPETQSDERPAVLASMPKIKMSFGKTKLPARPKAIESSNNQALPSTHELSTADSDLNTSTVIDKTETTKQVPPDEDQEGATSHDDLGYAQRYRPPPSPPLPASVRQIRDSGSGSEKNEFMTQQGRRQRRSAADFM